MAEKKTSSFKTFLLIILTLGLAFFLGCGAFLMLVPNSQLFGLCYVSNTTETKYTKTDGGDVFAFNFYERIVIDTSNNREGSASVNIKCGTNQASIVLKECTRGFTNFENTRKDYTLQKTLIGNVLNVKLTEPQFTFVKISNNTILDINLNSSNLPTNLIYEIKTNTGSVVFGGATSLSGHITSFTTPNLSVISESGNITIDSSTNITSNLSLKTTNGSINIEPNISANTVFLSAQKNKITANKITGNTTIESYNSHIKINEIGGDLILDTESGICEISKVGGDLSGDNLKYTTIYIKEILEGNVSLINNTDFTFKANRIDGEINIKAGQKPIIIKEINNKTNIETTSGEINIIKPSTNNYNITLKTKSGNINAKFYGVFGTNTINTTSGYVNIQYQESNSFTLNATANAGITLDWLNETAKSFTNRPIGAISPTGGSLNITNTNNKVYIGNFA